MVNYIVRSVGFRQAADMKTKVAQLACRKQDNENLQSP